MNRIIHFSAIVITGLGLLFCIISEATNNWYEIDAGTYFGTTIIYDTNQGLWNICSRDVCVSYPFTTDRIRAVRAFTILAILAYCAAMGSIILTFAKEVFVILFMLATFGAGVTQLIGMAIFTDTYNSSIGSFGYSFALGWIGCVLAGIACACGLLMKIMGHSENVN